MAGKRERVLEPYVGELTAEQVAVGINLARKNARRLADDARVLLDGSRVPSAAALAILSIEESGKPIVLRHMAIVSDAAAIRDAWQEFRRHTAKNSHWILPGLVAAGVQSIEGLRPAILGGEHSHLLESIKQVAVYADCIGHRVHWSDPEAVIDRELSEELVKVADALARGGDVTIREIELWIEHVKPYYASQTMGRAVVAYVAALEAEGLANTTPEQMASFLGDLLGPDLAD